LTQKQFIFKIGETSYQILLDINNGDGLSEAVNAINQALKREGSPWALVDQHDCGAAIIVPLPRDAFQKALRLGVFRAL
jgi:hypothetical protein